MSVRIANDALLAALNELLEAERAGARVALASRGRHDVAYRDLMRLVHVDESRWCAMLTRQIVGLGGVASPRCGTFHNKAIAISAPLARLAFLNRGQSWVVRKLEALLSQVTDDALRCDLLEMLESHRANIIAADALLAVDGR